MSPATKTYSARIASHSNPTAKLLLETIERKQSNLAVSVDITKSQDLLSIIDTVGPFVCLIKTHIDILEDFDSSTIDQLVELSRKHDFLYFEDRKFADIGNTVVHQYCGGLYKISSWSHITNAHTVPGPSVISGLASVGLPLGRGLLLLAEMSTKGTLAQGSYAEATVSMARQFKDFVIGFIAQRRMEGVSSNSEPADAEEDFLVLAPGVGLDVKGDTMGQQYRTPREVILDSGCDVIIVGRGIYGKDPSRVEEIRRQAERYQRAGWEAYLERTKQ